MEDLDDDPFLFKGQLLSRLDGGNESLLIGVDPGTRIGMAVYYGDAKIEFSTFGSAQDLCEKVVAFVTKVPAKKFTIRIGNGNQAMAIAMASSLTTMAPAASVEIVDESGTSARGAKMKGVQGDQRAAARIAFRKGNLFMRSPRSR